MTDSVGQAALDRALDEKDLLLIYQPIHEARSRKIVSAEALLRQRRESGEIREAHIITATAEQGPQLYRLDSWTIRTAYNDAAHWQKHAAPDVELNVNLSPREFEEEGILNRVVDLVTSCGLDAGKINLEITEVSFIERPEETVEVLQALKERGFGLWLDDFGTGHSSLEHLQHFPVDGLKIAGEFISGIETDARSREITRALIDLAHRLKIQVIAERVESQNQLNLLIDWGCEYIQGFLLSKPMTREELEKTLTGQASRVSS